MSSIDWQRLLREHDRAPERDDEAWLEALAILDEDPEEQRRAEDADPLMIFRRMPAPRVSDSDVESMKAAVKNLRHASETLAENAPQRRGVLSSRFFSGRVFSGRVFSSPAARRLWPLAALLALAISAALIGGLGPSTGARTPDAGATVAEKTRDEARFHAQLNAAPRGAGMVRAELRSADLTSADLRNADLGPATVRIDGASVAASLAAAELPLVEDADPGSDLLMQIENEEMSLVVVLTGQDV